MDTDPCHQQHQHTALLSNIFQRLTAAGIDMEMNPRGNTAPFYNPADGHQVAERGVYRTADDHLIKLGTCHLAHRHHVVGR